MKVYPLVAFKDVSQLSTVSSQHWIHFYIPYWPASFLNQSHRIYPAMTSVLCLKTWWLFPMAMHLKSGNVVAVAKSVHLKSSNVVAVAESEHLKSDNISAVAKSVHFESGNTIWHGQIAGRLHEMTNRWPCWLRILLITITRVPSS